jgi:hypothetical protein
VNFAREGLPVIAIAALVAAGTYALALNRRSWPLWLLAFAFTIAALWVAYFFSEPRRPVPRVASGVLAPVTLFAVPHGLPTPWASHDHARPISYSMNEFNVPIAPVPERGR